MTNKQALRAAALGILGTTSVLFFPGTSVSGQDGPAAFDAAPIRYKGQVLKTVDARGRTFDDLCISLTNRQDAKFFERPKTLLSTRAFECRKANGDFLIAMDDPSSWDNVAAVVGVGTQTAVAVSHITAEQKEADAAKDIAKAARDGAFADKQQITVEGSRASAGASAGATATSSTSQSQGQGQGQGQEQGQGQKQGQGQEQGQGQGQEQGKDHDKGCNKKDKHGKPTCSIMGTRLLAHNLS